jgi:hypothetical protein
MFKKARARGENLIKRQSSLLHHACAEKSYIQVFASTRNNPIRGVVQGFYRIESADLVPRVCRQSEFCLDLPCHYGIRWNHRDFAAAGRSSLC